jgi:hypothetical protein
LVTNITVDIGSNGIKTTYKLDLYTASFGKLQKQKQDAISKLSRERQKLKDEKNALIRRGLGKSQKNQNYKLIQESMFNNLGSPGNVGTLDVSRLTPPNLIVASNSRTNQQVYSPNGGAPVAGSTYGSNFGAVGDAGPIEKNINRTSVSMQNSDSLSQTAQNFPDQLALGREYYNTAAQSLDEQNLPASYDPYHPNMAYRPDPMESAKHRLYYPDGTTAPTGTTTWS